MATRFDGEITFSSNNAHGTQPKVKALPNGGYVVVYQSDFEGQDVWFEFRDALGRVTNNSRTFAQSGDQVDHDVAVLTNGDVVILWRDTAFNDIKGRRFAPDGAVKSDEFFVRDVDETQLSPSVIALADGGFATLMASKPPEQMSAYAVNVGLFNVDGTLRSNLLIPGGINPQTGPVPMRDPQIVQRPNGQLTVSWEYGGDTRFRSYLPDGRAASAEEILAGGAGGQGSTALASLSNGNLVAAFIDTGAVPGQSLLRGRIIGSSTNLDFKMTDSGEYAEPSVAVLTDGRFVVAVMHRVTATDKWSIRAQVFDANGTPSAGEAEFVVNAPSAGSAVSPSISVLRDGRFMVAWSEEGVGETHIAKGQVFDARASGVVVNGTSGNDIYVASSYGGDELYGNGGDDLLIDLESRGISTQAGDKYDGGANIDTVSYERVGAGVTASLADFGARNSGAAFGDSYYNVENLKGSAYGDELHGDGKSNTLTGGQGDDVLYGGAGSVGDRFVGGAGIDTVTFAYSTAGVGVAINLDDPSENAGEASGDVYESIEIFVGSDWDDHFVAGLDSTFHGGKGNDVAIGSHLNDKFYGESGNDDLRGYFGNDTLEGGLGSDILYGEDGDDTLDGGGENDILRGGAGTDSLVGGTGNDILVGGLGADRLIGGDGTQDMALYEGAQGVIANMTDRSKNTGEAAGDTYDGIENLAGTAFNDILTGATGFNGLFGQAGNDTLEGMDGDDDLIGGAGADKLDGGSGNDWAIYRDAKADANGNGVRINLKTNQHAGDEALGDELISIENVRGSAHRDILIGNAAANRLEGGNGDDWLYGGAGTAGDTLVGGGQWNYATYEYSTDTNGIVLDLLNRANDAGEAKGDVFIEITAYGGTNFSDRIVGLNSYNEFNGNGGNDTLIGGTSGDYLNGGDHADKLIGGAGADVLVGGDGNDSASYENASAGVKAYLDPTKGTNTGDAAGDQYHSIENLIGSAHADQLWGNGAGNVLEGRDNNDALYGLNGNDTLIGGKGDDILSGGEGSDVLDGGDGHDTYYIDSSDTAIDSGASGDRDTVIAVASGSYLLGEGIEDGRIGTGVSGVTLTGSNSENVLDGNEIDNTLAGAGGNDLIRGLHGNDVLYGDEGDDTVDGGEGDDRLYGGEGNDSLYGGENDDILIGGSGENTLVGGDGHDTLRAGNGTNTIQGGSGNDVYYVGKGDNVEIDESGIDTAYVYRFTFGDDTVALNDYIRDLRDNKAIENVEIVDGLEEEGTDGDDTLEGSEGNDTLDGGRGNDSINGHGGDDSLIGGDGNDTLNGGEGNDTLDGGVGDDVVNGNQGEDVLYGSEGNDTLSGGANNDTLNGGDDNDSLVGGDGDDSLDGGVGDDTLEGGLGHDTLEGGLGNDSMVGGDGDDVYYIRQEEDSVVETIEASGGTDKAYIFISEYALNDTIGIEILEVGEGVDFDVTLDGNSLNNTIIGGVGNDSLTGGEGDDVLKGGDGGIDTLRGGAGNDVYYAGAEDIIDDESGIDTLMVVTSGTHGLEGHDEVEILKAEAGVENIWLVGRPAGANNSTHLIGNELANTLESGGANETLEGGEGDDVYIVTSLTATINENGTSNGDAIVLRGDFETEAGLSVYIMADGVEILDAQDATGLEAILGNQLSNTIYGNNSGVALVGGEGNDTYYVGIGDKVTEGAGEGATDTVIVSGSIYALEENSEVEILKAAEGTRAIHLFGNNLSNHLIGNDGRNYLHGGAGGPDRFEGGDGNDTYIFSSTGDDLSAADTGGDMDVAYIWDDLFEGKAAEADLFEAYLKSMGIDYVYRNITPPPPPSDGQGEGDPTDIALSSYEIAEDAGALAIVGVLSATDSVHGPFKYSLVGDADEKFEVIRLTSGPAAGQWVLRLREGATLDFETNEFHFVDIEVTDIDGNQYTERNIQIGVIDRPEEPGGNKLPVVAFDATTVREHANAGTTVGVFSATDEDGDPLTYTLVDNADGRFVLDGQRLKVVDNTRIDFEDIRQLKVSIRVSDGKESVTKDFDIGVRNVAIENVTGTADANTIRGGARNDILNGAGGNDVLIGGQGADRLIGGLGNDQLTGGFGKDTFVFNQQAGDLNKDTITDFNVADDRIDLARSMFTAFGVSDVGGLKSTAFTIGSHAATTEHRIIYDQTTGVLSYDADGSGGSFTSLEFATLSTKPNNLTNTSFFIV
ncbi:Ca2+-binding RTX toxin-like protein [Microvirga lupini]|uniref:Ca2+-binding RTX toxin-like protein n=1 Tax=Microvirga lupini TaxID=420324 RepID=A0A7W4VMS8_9HYPH|nr:hypothetical protein [Microvirga lupini]MBB3019961.1 Ca2+-binding RTX toxin-like protein [Microvirga lupini]